MTNGVFKDDAERDDIIVRIDERQKEMLDDVKDIRQELKHMCDCVSRRLQDLDIELNKMKVWTGIFSAVFIPLVVYLLQRALAK